MRTPWPPPTYEGPNAGLVNEVIAFAFSEGVFSSSGPDEGRDSLLIVSDMRRAVDAAGDVGPEGHFDIEYTAMQRLMNLEDLSDYELELTWHDLQENLLAEYIWTSEYYQWRTTNEAPLRTIHSMAVRWNDESPTWLYDHLTRRLPEGPTGPRGRRGYYREFIANAAASDLMHCAENRAFNGLTDNYWEVLFQTYRLGLWPCGWHGTWPAPGKLIAWRRPAARGSED